MAEHRAVLPLGRLEPGEYLLAFEATAAERTARSLVRFKRD